MIIVRKGQDEQEAALRRYFARVARPSQLAGILLLAFGALVVWIVKSLWVPESSEPSQANAILLGLGILLIFAGLLTIISREMGYRDQLRQAQHKPSDSHVQTLFDNGSRKVIEHSQFMLSLGEEECAFRDPLVIITPVLHADSDDWSLWKQGEDGSLRFGYYSMIIIRLTDRHLGAYRCDYNFVRNVVLNERTTEYHYHDVVSVATNESSHPYDLPTGDKLTTRQEFSLSVASGESINVAVESALIRQITGGEGIPDSGAEKAVATIRAMLRDKKGSSHSLAAA
jgi:hypothetical protein